MSLQQNRSFALTVLAIAVAASTASAHFVWIAPGAETDEVQVVFAEKPAPGEPHLIDKIKQTKISQLDADGKPVVAELKKEASNAWQAKGESRTWQANCDYGVVDHGEKFHLHYYARLYRGEPATWQAPKQNGLPLDASLVLKEDKLTLAVTWQGKPAANAEVVLVAPEDSRELATNDAGELALDQVQEGRLAFRVLVSETAGELPVKHYLTVVADVPPLEFAEADPAAAKLLADARAERAVWGSYDMLTCQVKAVTSDGADDFNVTIEDGEVTVEGADGPTKEWLEDYLASMIGHRAPGSPGDETVRFVSEVAPHPLGRKLALGDELGSHYRIGDKKVMEVNRDMGPGAHFQISVLETVDNAEGKYLPAAFTIVTWDGDEIVSSLAEVDTWTRIGSCDVPATVVQTVTEGKLTKVYQLKFSDWREAPARTARR
jgi:hypothetical protein